MAHLGSNVSDDLKGQIIALFTTIKPAMQNAIEDSTAAVALATSLGSRMLTDEATAVELAVRIAIDATNRTSAMNRHIQTYVDEFQADRVSPAAALRAYGELQRHLQEKNQQIQERLIILLNLLASMTTEDLCDLQSNIPALEVVEGLLPGVVESLVAGRNI